MVPALFAFVIACTVAYLATPITGRLALHFNIVDHPSHDPSGHKHHLAPTPYLGGIAIFAGLIAGSSLLYVTAEGIRISNYVATIGAALFVGLIGLADDIHALPRLTRLVGQVLVGIAAWKLGFGVALGSPALALALTIFWVVGITNAFNLLDNMDGASAGLAAIAAGIFSFMGVINGLLVLPTIAAALAGAALGFLVHNRHPAKVFMGDAGSLFLGFLIAFLGMRLRFENVPEVTFMVPVVVLGLPILDTTLVVLSRIKHRRPIFLGGRDHVAHRLVSFGLSSQSAVRLMYLAAFILAWLGLAISEADRSAAFILLGLVGALGIFFGAVLWRAPVYKNSDVLQQKPAEKTSNVAPLATQESVDHTG